MIKGGKYSIKAKIMTISPGIFKAYDIRGLAPQEVTEEVAFRVGQAMVRLTKAKTVAVGHDMRETSPELAKAVMDGVRSQGADAVFVGGLLTTPMIYFATGAYSEHEAGIMVTASHNPSQYNGMKLCYGDASPIGAETGMKEIRDIVLAGRLPDAEARGGASELNIKTAYLDKVFSLVDTSTFRGLTVAVDTANGMEGALVDDIFARMPMMRLTTLFKELDGRFPNHEANPLKVETLDTLCAKVREIGADVGVAYDGDGDRVGFVDEKGEPIPGDLLLALLAPRLLRDAPGAAVVYDVRCSHAVPEAIEEAGGKPLMYKVGHGLIKPFMRKHGAVLGGELSMHYYFRDVFNADSTDLVLLLVFEMLSVTGKPLSELVAPLRRYHHSGEINSEVEDKDGVMATLRETYGALPGATVSDIDGVRVDIPDADGSFLWWFSVRASNTEPLLRLCLEARDLALMEEKREELLAIIRAKV